MDELMERRIKFNEILIGQRKQNIATLAKSLRHAAHVAVKATDAILTTYHWDNEVCIEPRIIPVLAVAAIEEAAVKVVIPAIDEAAARKLAPGDLLNVYGFSDGSILKGDLYNRQGIQVLKGKSYHEAHELLDLDIAIENYDPQGISKPPIVSSKPMATEYKGLFERIWYIKKHTDINERVSEHVRSEFEAAITNVMNAAVDWAIGMADTAYQYSYETLDGELCEDEPIVLLVYPDNSILRFEPRKEIAQAEVLNDATDAQARADAIRNTHDICSK